MSKVNHPAHYNTGAIEVIAAIDDWKLGFRLGNAVKYIARADHKGNPVEDLEKAVWYLQHEIARRTPPRTIANAINERMATVNRRTRKRKVST